MEKKLHTSFIVNSIILGVIVALLAAIIGGLIAYNNRIFYLLLGSIFGFFYILLALSKPFIAFLILALLAYSESFSKIQVVSGVSAMVLIGGLFVFVWIIRIATHKVIFTSMKEYWIIIALAITATLSAVANWGGPAGIRPTFTYFQQLLFIVLIVNFATTEEKLKELGTLTIFSSLVVATPMLIAKFGIISPYSLGMGLSNTDLTFDSRMMGFFGDPNYTSSQLIISVPFIVERLGNTQKRITQILLVVSLMLIMFAYSLTLSISGLISLAVYFIFKFFLFGHRNLIKRFTWGLVVFIIGFIVISNSLPDSFFNKIEANINTLFNSISVNDQNSFSKFGSNRGMAWQASYKAIINSPIIGYGPGNGAYASAKYNIQSDIISPAHNTILGIASDIGLLGTFFYVLLFLASWLSVAPYRGGNDQTSGMLLESQKAIFFTLVICLVLSSGLDINLLKFPMILLGMALACKRIIKKTSFNKQRLG